jgi:hypothetical protein
VRKLWHLFSLTQGGSIQNSCTIHKLPEGFQGDALIFDNSQPRASALEQSSRSICLCPWTVGEPGLLMLGAQVYVLPL